MRWTCLMPLLIALLTVAPAHAQTTATLSPTPTLQELLDYALTHTIIIRRAKVGEEIGEREIASSLSGYYPQVNATGMLNHYLEIPTNIIGGNLIQMGQRNTSNFAIEATQAILDPTLLQASRVAKFVRERNAQTTESEKINTVVDVSKAYYDILTTEEQINIIQENITRIQRQFDDAKIRYDVGIVDKTDHKRAQISLNNAQAELKKTLEFRKYKYDYLKQLLALPFSHPMDLSVNEDNLEHRVLMDSTQQLATERRVEYRQLQNQWNFQKINTQYQRWQFLPQLGAYANYQRNYFSPEFGNLYNRGFPASAVGLQLNFPIFQGMRRVNEIRRSQLMETQLEWDLQDLENQIGSEYSAAMSNYRAYLADWKNAKENVDLSEEVYNTIKLQYDEGIKTYLDLMTAETDLRTSQLNYLNALYALLASKIDVEKALGTIDIQQ